MWKTVEDDQILIHEGQRVGHIMLIVNGSVDLRKNQHSIRKIQAHNFIGEYCFTKNIPSEFTAVAENKTKLLVWFYDDLLQLFKEYPSIKDCFEELLMHDFASQIRNDDITISTLKMQAQL